MQIVTEKLCPKCGDVKSIESFRKHTGRKYGVRSWCVSCEDESNKNYKAANRSKIADTFREYFKKHADKIRFGRRVSKANKRGAVGSLSLDQWRTLCVYYGNKCLRCGKQGRLDMDHVVPISMGGSAYVDNVQPLCRSCNSFKNDRVIDYRPDGGEFARIIGRNSS